MASDVEDCLAYVTGRLPTLRRVAYPLSGDWRQGG
jgi:hypothetical protein